MKDKLKLDPLNKPIRGKEARELADEIHADEQAARVRDSGDAPKPQEGGYNPTASMWPADDRDKDRGGPTR